ncbi:hypothetical protein F3Y22_tig00110831pilonHSYRG00156 [Hibiscus syriacus]|uniref:DC1 domain-containing protein n=1 Tax=Hibiscus syriacus TaxID=106335 RepID=A0A6A2ZM07_HIBSY|nr:hypothetical protein F3Y22_tig00110831pilonHSYRG00156 [Hibiscus syriacus]
MKGGDMEIHHFSNQHPLLFIQDQDSTSEAACCFGCGRSLEGSSCGYGCTECKHYIHKGCAELSGSAGFVYHCASCKLDLLVNCALLHSPIAADFPTCLHEHPLFFVENHNEEIKRDCSGCMKPLSGPLYHCVDCSYPEFFNLHQECAELPLEIKHPYNGKHPLTLLPIPLTHPHNCSCYLCKIQWEGFVYSCSICKLELTPDDVITPPKITISSHKHPWKLLLRLL